MMLFRLPKTRGFSYHPKYFQPPPPEEEADSPRIRFRRLKASPPLARRSPKGMIIMVIILIFLLSYWLRVSRSTKDEFKFEEIRIEQVP